MLKANLVRSFICSIAFVLLATATALPAMANSGGDTDGALTGASISLYCNGGYCLSVNATDLPVGSWYTIDYSFTVTCSSGQSIPVSGSYGFTASAYTETVTITGNVGETLSGSCTVSNGTATITSSGSAVSFSGTVSCPTTPPLKETCPALTGTVGVPYDSCTVATGGVPPYSYNIASGTIPPGLTGSKITGCITGTPTQAGTFTDVFFVTDSTGTQAFTPACPIVIGPPVPTACVIPPIDSAISGAPVSWNGFKAPAGSVVWINAHLDAKNVPTNTITTVDFTGVTLVVNATSYALPNGQVIFNPAVSTAATVVNADGSWTTTVSPTFNNDIFFVGQAIPVDANMENGGGGNTGSTLSFTTNSSDSTLSFQWQWSAAVYTSWPGNAAANIEPVHAQQQAGAPLNPAVEADLIQGPRGGGGSNFTGSWSGTGQGVCPQ